VVNIRDVDDVMRLSTNGGKVITAKKATIYGEVWFSTQAITNIFSLLEMEKKIQSSI
jgi:hypothetical protein